MRVVLMLSDRCAVLGATGRRCTTCSRRYAPYGSGRGRQEAARCICRLGPSDVSITTESLLTSLSLWEATADVRVSERATVLPVALDFTNAITLVATFSLQSDNAYSADATYPHFIAVTWWLQDSLDERLWFTLDHGKLRSNSKDVPEQQVARISAAIGTSVRVALSAELTVLIPTGSGTFTSGPCNGMIVPAGEAARSCGVDHDALIGSVRMNLAARSI
jgi:hypothetical protein